MSQVDPYAQHRSELNRRPGRFSRTNSPRVPNPSACSVSTPLRRGFFLPTLMLAKRSLHVESRTRDRYTVLGTCPRLSKHKG